MTSIVISVGHGKKIRGASGKTQSTPWGLDEVDEACRVVPEVAKRLTRAGHKVVTFFDETSTTQDQNLKTIVEFHNSQTRDVDVSFHFNASDGEGHGVEVLYVTQEDLAGRISAAIAAAGGLKNRGAKYRGDLYVLNNTDEPAVLIEVCFCDNEGDCAAYRDKFDAICQAIADVAEKRPASLKVSGKVSWFGGPKDTGVDEDEGLAFFYKYDDAPELFLDEQPDGTTGLARRLDPDELYVACRWDYDITPKEMLASELFAMVRNKTTGEFVYARPADWGPHEDTDRVADVSPAVMETLGIETDDVVEVIYPVPG